MVNWLLRRWICFSIFRIHFGLLFFFGLLRLSLHLMLCHSAAVLPTQYTIFLTSSMPFTSVSLSRSSTVLFIRSIVALSFFTFFITGTGGRFAKSIPVYWSRCLLRMFAMA
uniref:Uncharacterized protein n=1 Tax=Cacopsylla melanoneura TaxID=428564 RepID=A0A8D8XF08_9HEMI